MVISALIELLIQVLLAGAHMEPKRPERQKYPEFLGVSTDRL